MSIFMRFRKLNFLFKILSQNEGRVEAIAEIRRRYSKKPDKVLAFCKNTEDIQINYFQINGLFPEISSKALFDWKIIDHKTIPDFCLKENLNKIDVNNFKTYDEYHLFKALMQSDDIYKYNMLIELLTPYYINSILKSPNILLNKFPNFENLLKKVLKDNKIDISDIFEKILVSKNFNLLSVFMNNYENITNAKIHKIINLLNTSDFNTDINLLHQLNPQVFNQLLNNGLFYTSFFKKLNTNELNQIFIESTVNNISDNMLSLIIKLYDSEEEALITNNTLYERLKSNTSAFFWGNAIIRLNSNFDEYINIIGSSKLIDDLLNNANLDKESNETILEKLHSHIPFSTNPIIQNFRSLLDKLYFLGLNNEEIFKYLLTTRITKAGDYDIDLRNKPNEIRYFNHFNSFMLNNDIELSKLQSNIIMKYFPRFMENYDVFYKYLEKYPSLKEDLIANPNELMQTLEALNQTRYIDVFNKYPEILEIVLKNSQSIKKFILIYNQGELLKKLSKYPKVATILFKNTNFINTITENEQIIFEYLRLLVKYNVTNSTIKMLYEGFTQIQKERKELSLKNSSLKKEMLHPDFIKDLGVNYINSILEYDSQASNIVVELYNHQELTTLRNYLDYLTTNIANTRRMIHFYILAFNKTKELVLNLQSVNHLTTYQQQILEEIIANNNKYNIKNIQELNNYFNIKAQNILKEKKTLSKEDVLEIFLNDSARYNGEPWDIPFFIKELSDEELAYFKYKYIDTNVITLEEFKYLASVNEILKNNCDISQVMQLIDKTKEKHPPTIRSLYKKMYNQYVQEFNDSLIDLDVVRSQASYTDPNSEIFITIQDGVETIYLNGYDFKLLGTAIGFGDSEDTFKADSEANFYRGIKDRVFGETLKDVIDDETLENYNAGKLILNNPQTWNLIEGVSTISCGVVSSRYNPQKTFGWGRKSQIKINGASGADAATSHKLRDLKPHGSGRLDLVNTSKGVLYANKGTIGNWTEVWFDRNKPSEQNYNERLQPEFVISNFIGDYQSINAAKTFNCPRIIVVSSKYKEIENKLDNIARIKYAETFNKKYLYDIWYNSNISNEKKLKFLIQTLITSLKEHKITLEVFKQKLIDIKWFLYENSPSYMPTINNLLISINDTNLEKDYDFEIILKN